MKKTLLSCKHLRNISLNADVNFHLLSISEVGRMFKSKIPYFINIKWKTTKYPYLFQHTSFVPVWHASKISVYNQYKQSWSQWPNILSRGCEAHRLLGLRVRIPSEEGMSFSFELRVLSGGGLCDRPITHPEESYWLWCVIVRGVGTFRLRRPWPSLGCSAGKSKTFTKSHFHFLITVDYAKI